MNRQKLQVLFIVSSVGLIINGLAHISSFLAETPRLEFLGVWVILIGFVAICGQPASTINRLIDQDTSIDFWTAAMKSAPLWMKALFIIVTLYALFNFIYWALLCNGNWTRVISGYCTVFYLIATLTLFYRLDEEK